jgi:hypothetical protein
VTLISGRTVKGARELATALDEDGDFDRCAVRQMNAYAFGVGHVNVNPLVTDAQMTAWKTSGGSTKSLVRTVAMSAPFKQVCGTRN